MLTRRLPRNRSLELVPCVPSAGRLGSTRVAERVQGGHLVARAIAAEGVDAIFTLSGGHVMPIYEGCRHEGVRVLDVRHEQSAAHAAEAYGRVRPPAGVAVVTAGPGVTGTVTAVANAFAAQVPLVVIGGARPLVQAEKGSLQEFDQLSLMKPITKWAAICVTRLADPGVRRDRLPSGARATTRARSTSSCRWTSSSRTRRPTTRRAGRACDAPVAARSRRRREAAALLARRRAAGDRRRPGDLVGRRRRALDDAGHQAPGTGVPERLRPRLAPARPSSALPACPFERACEPPMSCSSSARRSTSAFGTGVRRGQA